MQALIYLLRRQYINKFKRLFSSVLSAIITIISILGFGSSIVFAFTLKKSTLTNTNGQSILAGILLMMGVILYNAFLSRDSGILTMADANFMFTGPFEKRTVLAYLLISTAPATFFMGFFMSFYMPYILGPALTFPKFLVALLIISLMFGCIYLSYYYIYVVDAEKRGLKKKVWKAFLALMGILVLVFVLLLYNTNFDVQTTARKFFTHPLYNWFPIFGWAKWAISSILLGDFITGFLPAAALLILMNTVLCFLLYNVKTDFYEKTLEDSENLQKLIDDIKSNGSADARSVAKLKKKSSNIRFYKGAAAILSKQMLEYSKLNLTAKLREIFMGLIYVVVTVMFGLDFNFAFGMIGFGALSMSLSDSWHRDFKKPYVYLIPASSFSKVMYSVLPGLIKTSISGSVTISIAAIILKVSPEKLIGYLLIFISFVILFIFAEVLTYRLIGPNLSAMAIPFLRMIFAIFACIPALILLIVISLVSGNYEPNLLVTAMCMFPVNVAISALFAFLSRGIFEQSEIMD